MGGHLERAGEGVPERRASPVAAHTGVAGGDAERLRGLGDGEPVDGDQLHDGSLALGQDGETPRQAMHAARRAPLGIRRDRRRRPEDVGRQVGGCVQVVHAPGDEPAYPRQVLEVERLERVGGPPWTNRPEP